MLNTNTTNPTTTGYATIASSKPPVVAPKPAPVKPMTPLAPISSGTEAEIKRKAIAGEALSNPNANKTAMYDMYRGQAVGSNFASAQQGYGIGYAQDNLGGGFSAFGDEQAIATERARVNTVMANRTKAGLSNSGYDQYLARLDTASSPFAEADKKEADARSEYDAYKGRIDDTNKGYRNDYNESQAKADANKWSSATIDDIAKKYGFDYSRDYAKQQAESEAQALRNANEDAKRRNESNKKTGTANIDNNLMNMAEGLDRNYFQKMMQQQQGQVSSGLNGGIASDQDLRLQMNRQAEMGASYRDANMGKMKIDENYSLDDIRLTEQGGLINQQALAREDSLYNTRLQEGFGNLMTEREMANARDQQEWSKMFSELGRNDGLDQQQWARSQDEVTRATQDKRYATEDGQFQQGFDYNKGQDTIKNDQWDKTFDYQEGRDEKDDYKWSKEFRQGVDNDTREQYRWSKEFNQNKDQTKIQNGQWSQEFQQGKHEYTTDNNWRKTTFNNMSASEKAQLENNKLQFGEDMAWRLYDQEYQGNLATGEYNAEISAYTSSGGTLTSSTGQTASNGTPTSFGGYRYADKAPKEFTQHMSSAVSKGVPFADVKLLTEMVGRESSFKATADNPTSTAYGYGQFLDATRADYKKKYPKLDYKNPVDQLVLMHHYIKDRYGTVEKALQSWESRSPHWY
jgi:hypothetical protein